MQKGQFISKGGQGSFPWSWRIWNVQVGRTITFSLFITLYRPVFNKPSRAHFFKYRRAVCWFVANCRYRQRIFFIYDTWRYTTKLWKCEPYIILMNFCSVPTLEIDCILGIPFFVWKSLAFPWFLRYLHVSYMDKIPFSITTSCNKPNVDILKNAPLRACWKRVIE